MTSCMEMSADGGDPSLDHSLSGQDARTGSTFPVGAFWMGSTGHWSRPVRPSAPAPPPDPPQPSASAVSVAYLHQHPGPWRLDRRWVPAARPGGGGATICSVGDGCRQGGALRRWKSCRQDLVEQAGVDRSIQSPPPRGVGPDARPNRPKEPTLKQVEVRNSSAVSANANASELGSRAR